ncbi:hypothetical protein GGX14DRAFT_500409 [Mycena pura]|uniref:NAD-dependent epimerase/dehydratase domain-containing protein n=1 Tax=Mycena pura TaxID=153505 RepID=A0AAD6Y7U9_9AGAR|nr:hypothetical protein GGX14DRAFT_500409 [Mycena pura]
MNILILGATGFIGFPAAQALVRAGHTVYGLSRTEAKAKLLAAEELIPVIGDVDSDNWIPLIAKLDIIIEAVGGGEIVFQARTTFERVLKAVADLRSADAPLLSYIYTSGGWVHGDSRTEVVTDTTPIVRPLSLVTWRPAVEQLVARSTAVNGIVVRPAIVYGRSASLLAMLFMGASQGRVTWPGTPGGRYPVVHTDDLADLYVRMTEKASLLGGKIFDVATPNLVSVDELLQRVVEVSGAKGPYEYTRPTNAFEEALAATVLVRPYLANALLGWSPRKPGLIENIEVYYAAWVASGAGDTNWSSLKALT